MKSIMNIATAINGKYAKYLLVMLQSLFKNNPNRPINVYVLNSGLGKTEQDMILDACKNPNHQIVFLEVDISLFDNVRTMEFTVETYFRLAMLELLPIHVTRLLYLDVDIIVNASLDPLYDMTFEDQLIVACTHRKTEQELKEGIHLGTICPERGECFNAGVVLYNIEEIRGKYSFQDFEKVMQETDYYYDQGVLNYLFWDKAIYIDTLKYNNRGYQGIDINDIVIIHYAAGNPWELWLSERELQELKGIELLDKKRDSTLNAYYMHLTSIWWDYAKETPVYDLLKYEREVKQDYFMRKIVREYFVPVNREIGRLRGTEMLINAVLKYGSIAECFCQQGVAGCAIYGLGKVGRYVLGDLKKNNFPVTCYIDRREYLEVSIPYRHVGEIEDISAPIIVCVMYDGEKIKKRLLERADTEVLLLSDMLA